MYPFKYFPLFTFNIGFYRGPKLISMSELEDKPLIIKPFQLAVVGEFVNSGLNYKNGPFRQSSGNKGVGKRTICEYIKSDENHKFDSISVVVSHPDAGDGLLTSEIVPISKADCVFILFSLVDKMSFSAVRRCMHQIGKFKGNNKLH